MIGSTQPVETSCQVIGVGYEQLISMRGAAGLVSAMYMKDGREVACPDPAAGLYIRNRQGAAVKVTIPADHVAFQMGEAMQVNPVYLPHVTQRRMSTSLTSQLHAYTCACAVLITGRSHRALV